MSCFWDTLINRLNNDLKKCMDTPVNPTNFVIFLKAYNQTTINVRWNGKELTKQQCQENYSHINDYDISTINNGYDCSCCDPFLLLVCEIMMIDIHNNYIGTNIIYSHILNKNNRHINIQNDKGHMK